MQFDTDKVPSAFCLSNNGSNRAAPSTKRNLQPSSRPWSCSPSSCLFSPRLVLSLFSPFSFLSPLSLFYLPFLYFLSLLSSLFCSTLVPHLGCRENTPTRLKWTPCSRPWMWMAMAPWTSRNSSNFSLRRSRRCASQFDLSLIGFALGLSPLLRLQPGATKSGVRLTICSLVIEGLHGVLRRRAGRLQGECTNSTRIVSE